MQTFVWDQHFVTGLPIVDDQHRELVALINALGNVLVAGDDRGEHALDETFARLEAYARRHFTDEEALMARAGLGAGVVAHHRHRHDEFIEQVARMWRSRASMSHPAEVLHGFLSAWLAFHILGEDQAMARQVRAQVEGHPERGVEIATDAAPGHGPEGGEGATTALLRALQNLYHVLSVQNRDLANANAHLEKRVAERTHELQVANEALRRMSRTDGLLGIANRAYFEEKLAQEWSRARRNGQFVGLMMLDVDHFKRFNDALGHPAGDRCLQAVAETVSAAIRRPGDLLARYGGEELVVVLPDTNATGVLTVAKSVLAGLESLRLPHPDSPTSPFVTLSGGVASLRPADGGRPEALIAAADAALYEAKTGGRNQMRMASARAAA